MDTTYNIASCTPATQKMYPLSEKKLVLMDVQIDTSRFRLRSTA